MINEYEKSNLVSRFKDLEALAYAKRLEFLTVQVLPDCEFKNLKLIKLQKEEQELIQNFWVIMTTLLINYWEDIYKEII